MALTPTEQALLPRYSSTTQVVGKTIAKRRLTPDGFVLLYTDASYTKIEIKTVLAHEFVATLDPVAITIQDLILLNELTPEEEASYQAEVDVAVADSATAEQARLLQCALDVFTPEQLCAYLTALEAE